MNLDEASAALGGGFVSPVAHALAQSTFDNGSLQLPIAQTRQDRTIPAMNRSAPASGTTHMSTAAPTLGSLPSRFIHLPGWLPQSEADPYLDVLTADIPWEQTITTIYGKTHPTPRLTCWFADVAYSYAGIRNEPRSWPAALTQLRRRLEERAGAEFDSCLANLYRDGNDTVGFHQDNEPGLDPRDPIASISLGATRDFRIREIATKRTWTLPLAHGDLLLMLGPDSQTRFQHAVPRRSRAGARINLTFRRYHDAG